MKGKTLSIFFSRMGAATLSLLLLNACTTAPKPEGGWFVLKWMEKPGRVASPAPMTTENETRFLQVASYDPKGPEGQEKVSLAEVTTSLREGDVIAYRMGAWEARKDILLGDVAKIGYRLFKYGHLAIVARDPADISRLRIFSSQSFRGPNVREGLDTLEDHHFDVYRLEHAERVDWTRLTEFVDVAIKKAGNVLGYDFSGMFGLWNSNLKPTKPEEIGHDYICSTVVATALYYTGVDMNVSSRHGALDIVTPLQVVEGRGHFVRPAEGVLEVARTELQSNAAPVAEKEIVRDAP